MPVFGSQNFLFYLYFVDKKKIVMSYFAINLYPPPPSEKKIGLGSFKKFLFLIDQTWM